MEWWETSPFKKAYDTYIKPIVDSLRDLMNRIKSIWANFKWDENKSFVDNLMGFWDNIKSAIREWWNSSIIKTYWDMLVNYVKDLLKPIKDWYD